ncbi:intradiol ring-cleavage dioxygenase [Oceanicola sp. 502str15]|uniref:intradiol ring-cleavage dioxygenase n=1 Tax=Oceanicola sp. 502str15 TaxID=2696061 RepID=UPI002094B442|nr:intradiol ring-cleavage dioxygenase [Oceanicola sp. 502str15]MCO6382802.1 protocatechuate dioxygenase [Oceanicola sp. 502str15]
MTALSRRRLLTTLAALPLSALAARSALAQEGGLITGNVCLIQRETTEGPYYIDPGLIRADVTEGLPGLPLALALQVVNADCRPIEGARVDIWHCDAVGRYSGYARENTNGETFLRGTQITGAGGVARFSTIYPGWYRGRAVHVHYKVWLNSREVLTSQLFFPEAVSDQVYEKVGAYGGRGARDRRNENDRIAQGAGKGAVAALANAERGLQASLVAGIAA